MRVLCLNAWDIYYSLIKIREVNVDFPEVNFTKYIPVDKFKFETLTTPFNISAFGILATTFPKTSVITIDAFASLLSIFI